MESNKIKASIIIPVYNTKKYVRQTVKSIMNQTLKELEIIIINDGSTDESLKIVEELALQDNRIQIYSQANQGLSVARNEGIAHAQGEYLYFMDSDDLLNTNALEMCYHKCEEKELDFVFFDARTFRDDGFTNIPQLSYQHTEKLEDNKVYSGIEVLKMQLQNYVFTPSACLNVIRRRFLADCHLLFYPGIVHEDQLFTVKLYLQASKVACIHQAFFQRRLRDNSIMTSKFSSNNLKGYLTVTHELLDFKKQAHKKEIREVIDLHLSQMLNAVIWQAHTLPISKRMQLAFHVLLKYKRYVTTKNIGVLLFKSLIHQQSKNNG
ncbi:glycosyltransferase [Bacteroides bouchesdurhonensis]|uniref:glycosyltransferase n=1 Tax=Bacteroides bouchesdurhonensis TaxID=1841855 RepID=UPI00097F7EBF|nr:glycosyltransferase [Bacteroides bouchesdurhonensis]